MDEPRPLPAEVLPADVPSAEGLPVGVRPPFARDWPRNAELEPLLVAFALGNFDRIRRGAPRLEARALEQNDEVLAAHVRELLERTRPEPLAKWLFLLALVLALGLTVSAYAGGLVP